MTAALYAVDPYRKNAYSDHVSFDLEYKSPGFTKVHLGIENTEKAVEEYNPEVSQQKTPAQVWEMDVRTLVNSKKWLSQYGLRRSKLTLYQILPVIGFKVSDDFDRSLKRPISSRYADGLFHQIFRPDGKTFNITCSREQLRQIEARLNQSLNLFKRRLEWLTTESRRLFGVIEEKAVTIVLDIRNMSPVHFDQYRMALERVIYEQLTQVVKFNLIRSTDDIEYYHRECVPVTHDTIQNAVTWVWNLDRLAPVAKTTTCEAVKKAANDPNNEAIYLFTEGSSIESCKEILKEKVKELPRKVPVHVVAFNCDDSGTIRFLKDFTERSGTKFHAYSVIMEMDSYEPSPVDPRNNRANIVLKKCTYGGVPPGAGMREDVALLFEEIEEARNTISQVQAIMEEVPEPKVIIESVIDKTDLSERDEQYMGTKQWLSIYGLGARRLELWDVLGSVAFKHQDGVVDLKVKPHNHNQTEAITHSKLINARYCERFPVVKWKDGQVMHVQVTPEIHRRYEKKMNIAMKSFQQRIDWLKQGSRALFGTVIEDQIYVLIDTSASMLPSITFVKDRLFVLMQEQLRHKKKFNLVSFNSKATAWQNRMVDVNEQSLIGAWKWIQNLSCWGSTNTYAGLQHALSDPGTQAIYLLSDGRPDQPPKSIIAQVQMQHCVPVHAISFNCNDTEANQFLSDLAQATDGRYHYFSEKGMDPDQPKSWESEDIRLLKEEIRRGLEHLEKIEDLRDECSTLSWKSEVETMKERRCSRNHALPGTDKPSSQPPMDPALLFRPDPLNIPRPKSAPPPREDRVTPSPPPRSASPTPQKSSMRIRKYSRPTSARKSAPNPLTASHTRTSLLRTMTSTGRFDPEEWLLPETRQLFEKQAKQQQQLAEALQRYHLSPYVLERRKVDQKRERARSFRKKRLERAKETSSKLWLSKNGLVAKKLTILDALAPTFIPRTAKYVPILDKHILSKVFDEILPIAHVSSKKPNMTLINPAAVDLHGYEKKVHKAIVSYHKRLNKIVWEALPEESRKKFDSDRPIPFVEHRNELLDELDHAGWPIKENDILLLEEEINRANNFLQQSKDLRRAADPRRKDSYDNLLERVMDMDEQERRSRSHSPSSSESESDSDCSDKGSKKSNHSDKGDRSIRSDRGENSVKSDRGDRSVRSDRSKDRKDDDELNVYDDKASIASSLTDKSTHDFFEHYRSLLRKVCNNYITHKLLKKKEMEEKLEDLHLKNHYKDFILKYYDELNHGGYPCKKILKNRSESNGSLSHVMKSHPETVYDSSRLDKIQFNPTIIKKVLDTLRGQSVIARNDKDGFYYPGTVLRCPDPRHAVIQFEDKEERTIPTRLVIAVGGAIPWPILRVGDCVLVRVQYSNAKSDCYVPGIVQVTPAREESSNKFYTVLMFNGQQATTSRNLLMKISKSRFEFAIRYIADIQNVDSKEYEDKVYITPRTPRTPRPSDKEKKVGYRRQMKVIVKKSKSKKQNRSPSLSSRSRSASPVQSRSRSSSRSRSRSRSTSRSRSRSRSKSRSRSRSRSRSPSRSRSRSRSASSRSRSPSQEKQYKTGKKSRSRSYSSSASESESIHLRPKSSSTVPDPIKRPESPVLGEHEAEERRKKRKKERKRKEKLKILKQQLILQQEEQQRQQMELKKQRKRMKKMKKKLKKKRHEVVRNDYGPVIPVESSDSDSDLDSKDGGKGDGSVPGLILLRKSLPRLRVGEEVLARWSDEGWYFRGIVKEDCKDYSYIVEDATHQFEKIWREDIITDYDDANQILQPKDPIVALHPNYAFSYAPAIVLEVYHNMWMKVRFYDGDEAKIPRDEAFKLTTEKFEHDVNYIIECETRWVGQAVVARDDRYGTYHLASVKKRIGNGRTYLLEWCDGNQAMQNSIHIFGVYTKHHRLAVGDYVLAMLDEQQHMYLPGWIAGIVGEKINIKFCDGSIKDVDDVLQCFWLSSDYYDNAVQYFSKCQDVDTDEVATTNKEEF